LLTFNKIFLRDAMFVLLLLCVAAIGVAEARDLAMRRGQRVGLTAVIGEA